MFETIFTYLYPSLSLICSLGFLPQIRAFVMAKSAPSCFSFLTWAVWMFESLVSAGYGLFTLKNMTFSMLSLVDVMLIAAVIGLGLYTKHIRFGRRQDNGSGQGAAVEAR